MKQYLDMVNAVLDEGTRKENRTGIDTISTFIPMLFRHDLQEGFPLLTTKKVHFDSVVHELLWFISGDPDIRYLSENNVKIWDEWADEAEWIDVSTPGTVAGLRGSSPETLVVYDTPAQLEADLKAKGFRRHTDRVWVKGKGKVDAGYGPTWRAFPYAEPIPLESDTEGNPILEAKKFDQLKWVIGELVKNPMSRRMVVIAWNPPVSTQTRMSPCHYTFVLNVQNVRRAYCDRCGYARQFRTISPAPGPLPCPQCANGMQLRVLVRPELCLHWTQRSCDIALGVPFNIASYALLCHIIAQHAGLPVGFLAGSFIDLHAYTKKPDGTKAEYDHVPGLMEQLKRMPKKLPRVSINPEKGWGILERDDIVLTGYDPYPAIPFKVAV